MKRKFVFLIFILLSSVNLYSQGWIRIYSDSLDTEIHSVHEHYDKGYLFSGAHYEGWSYYGFLMKTDINGEILWKKSYGLPVKMTQFFSSRMTGDGGLILAGSTNNVSASCTDPVIIKVNSCGEKEWCKIFNAPGCDSWFKDVEVIFQTEYFALITQWKTEEEERIWLFRLDSAGEVIWAQAYATNPDFKSESPHSLLQTNDSCLVITGEAYYPDPTYPNKWILKIILIKVNLNGEPIFEVPWGPDNGIYSDGRLSVIDLKNNIYTSGRRARKTTPYGDSPCLFKTSPTGDPVFYKDLKSTSILGESTTINWFQDSTMIQCIDWFDTSGADSTGLIKTDSLGNFIKEQFIFLNKDDILRASDITFNNRLILAGSVYNDITNNWQSYAFKFTSDLEYDSVYTTPFTYDSLCPHAITSDTIPLDDCEVVIVGIDDPVQNPEKTKLKVYPNPAANTITVEMPEYLVRTADGGRQTVDSGRKTAGIGITATTYYHQWKSARLDVFDLFGKLMHSEEIPGKTDKIDLDISSWPAGMYVARIVFMNDVVGVVKFIKE